ncbi:MAG: FtsX-like permease family protein, partial [Motiliproteus sp.]|nr:FtsX-like permease family protein [Motiliproteus sp.]
LALRLLWREWKGGELRLLLAALLIAVTASSAVGFFSDRVERALVRQATEFLGADLVLTSARPFESDLRQQAQQRQLQYSEQLVFASMLIQAEQMLLSTVKAVDSRYPLKGAIKVAEPRSQDSPEVVKQGPGPGTIWLEPRIMESLQLQLGDSLELGSATFRVDRVLLHEPDRGGGLFSLQPRALINLADIPATEIVQPGSRVTYRYLFNGDPAQLEPFRQWLDTQLKPGQRILNVERENASLGTTLKRAQSYLNLSGLLAVIMASIAIAMAARRFSERHYDQAALLRCLGQRQKQILKLYIAQLLIAGTLVSSLGVALGWFAQYALVELMSGLLPGDLPGPGLEPALIGLATGLLVLAGFSLPPLLRLSSVSPLRVLRRELNPLPISAWMVYGMAALLIAILLFVYTQDIRLTLIVAGIGSVGSFILGLLAWFLLKLLTRISGPMSWRLASKNLQRHPSDSLGQLFAFGITLAAMTLILSVRNDLVENWEKQLPEQAPNNFLINIQAWQVPDLEQFFQSKRIQHSGIYPMVRGRLSHINEQSASQWLPEKSPGRRAISRELNLTWSAELAEDNRLVDGRWWQAQDKGKPYISLEADLARDLGVTIGDQLRFDFGDRNIDAEIISLRTLDWGSLRPNFYVIFPPDSLQGLPANYITSFYLDPERSLALNELLQQFPTLTLLEVEQLLSNIRQIVAQVAIAVEYVMLFVLAAGVTVLFAALASSIDERLQEGALLRTLGANRRTLTAVLSMEFALVGAVAGLLASILNEGILFWLYGFLFNLDYQPSPSMWLINVICGAVLVTAAGLYATRRIIKHPPITVFRDL